jgi:hypothetical protein
MILSASSRMNRAQALPEVWFEGVRCLVQSLGAGVRRQGYLGLLNGVTSYKLWARAQQTVMP